MKMRFDLPGRSLLPTCLIVVLAAGCGGKEPMYKASEPKAQFTMRLAKEEAFAGGKEFVLPQGKEMGLLGIPVKRLFVSEDVVLGNEHVTGTSAAPDKEENERWKVEIFLTPAGRERLARATRENIGGFLAVYIDGEYETAIVIWEEARDKVVPILGLRDQATASALAQKLAGQ